MGRLRVRFHRVAEGRPVAPNEEGYPNAAEMRLAAWLTRSGAQPFSGAAKLRTSWGGERAEAGTVDGGIDREV